MEVQITTFFMFAGNAEQAMNFYITIFPNSEIIKIIRYSDNHRGHEGKVKLGIFILNGKNYRCTDSIVKNDFSFNPSISLYIDCSTEAEFYLLFSRLSKDGDVLMPIDNYGFSKLFGWTNDRFGVSWQINLA